jgi:GTP-binding protein EngB required for normal cell division
MIGKSTTVASQQFLSTAIDRVRTIRTQYRMAAIDPHLEACGALLEERGLIDVGIFGRFKAGKSSLLNLLAKRNVLPVGVTPVTAVITRLRYGSQEQATVRYSDGRTERVPVAAVTSYVSEGENRQNTKGVAAVTVELPALEPYQGLQFVDTPGLDSVFQHNTDAALGWLPKVGLALVTISVDPPLSMQDVALIRTLRSYTPKIAIVLTKVDLLSETERNEVATFIYEQLRREFGVEFRICPFSIRPAYAELNSDLDRELLRPLLEKRDTEQADIVRFKFDALLKRTKEYLALALAAAERADADRFRLKSLILNEKTSYESIRMELQALARECASQTRPWIMKRMGELYADIERCLTRELQFKLSGLKANLWKLSRAFEQWLDEALAREMKEISLREGPLFCVPLDKAQETLARAVQGFRDRLAANIFQALGTRFAVEPFDIELRKPVAPDIRISNLFMFNTDLLWFIIPMSLFRSWADRHFLKRIPDEVEKNLARLASQWSEKINTVIQIIQREAERRIREQISTVESLLSSTQSEVEDIRSAIVEIESLGSNQPLSESSTTIEEKA